MYCYYLKPPLKIAFIFGRPKNFFLKKLYHKIVLVVSTSFADKVLFCILSEKRTLRKHVSIHNKYPEIFVTYTTVFPQKCSRTEQNPLYSSIKIPPPKWFKLEIGGSNPHPLGWFKHLIKGYDIPNLMLSIRNAPVFLMCILYIFFFARKKVH